ncbi:hypothetical protein CLU79DRAFT_844795 [Phycomyces nitens]|nr:hypothetical protein CLU79DRAFT_844795 [Phycomyces nitens]
MVILSVNHRPALDCLIVFGLLSRAYAQTTNNLPYNPSLGPVKAQVPWRSGHVAVYIDPFVLVYGGALNPSLDSNVQQTGSNDLWAWDARNGSWYNPQPQIQQGNLMKPQIHFGAVVLPSPGQMLAVASNTTEGAAAGMLQKLDVNAWTWNFPTVAIESPLRFSSFAVAIVNNTVYSYGGLSVDSNGFGQSNGVQNSLHLLDANSFQWTTGSNGPAVADHSMCYVPSCNCLVVFGGTSTGSPTDATQNVYIYDLDKKTWNIQITVGTVGGAAPGARRLHSANCLENSMVVYGGGTTQPYDSDVWLLDLASYPTLTWNRINMANVSQSPSQRMGHSAVLDEVTKKIFIFGGWGGTGATNDSNMYVLDTTAWSWTRMSPAILPSVTSPDSPQSTGINNGGNSSVDPADTPTSSSKGVIAGAVVGALAGIAIIGALVFCFIKRKKRQEAEEEKGHEETTSTRMSDNPFYWRQGQSADGESYLANHPSPASDANLMAHYSNKRVSEPWTNNSSPHHSTRFSEIGDTDRIHSGVLEMIPPVAAFSDSGSNVANVGGSRTSLRNSKILLLDSYEMKGPGQVPNEHITQKPNEFSQPAIRFSAHNQNNIRIHHQNIPSGFNTPRSGSVDLLSTIDSPGYGPQSFFGVQEDTRTSGNLSMPQSPVQYSQDTSNDNRSKRPSLDLITTLNATENSKGFMADSAFEQPWSESHSPLSSVSRSTGVNGSTPLDPFSAVAQLITRLPSTYEVDRGQTPLIGPTNAIVFVHSTADKKPAVIKSFGRREAWERECRTLTLLKSPFVVKLLEVMTIQHDPKDPLNTIQEELIDYVTVMEELDETLASVIRQARKSSTPWTSQKTRSTVREIVECLVECHAKGIAFCDLKPSNIMRHVDGRWQLIDFESSRNIGEECVGVITPRYCPPEVAKATTYGIEGTHGVVATISIDLWALGCIIYELETKNMLFSNSIKDETILHFMSHPSPSTPALKNGLRWDKDCELEIPEFEENIPDPVARQTIQQLLSREPAMRGTASSLLK